MPLGALLLSDGDADALLELALLQLWAANDPERLAEELLGLDTKCWRRLGLLVFASTDSLVLARGCARASGSTPTVKFRSHRSAPPTHLALALARPLAREDRGLSRATRPGSHSVGADRLR